MPDLKTRLAITPVTSIGHPDDTLFSALIQLHFADRGLHIPPDALRFMCERLHRDYWTAERAVEAVDRHAIAERARLSLPTIRRALIEIEDDRRSGLAAAYLGDLVGGVEPDGHSVFTKIHRQHGVGWRPAQHRCVRRLLDRCAGLTGAGLADIFFRADRVAFWPGVTP